VRAGYGLGRDEITALAAAEPAGCDGVSFVPFLAGERTPNWPQ
jgi:xylulokinase